MKPKVTLLSALLITVTIFSCSKNNDQPAESTVLKSYTSTFRDSIVYFYFYERDANNKIISMRDSTKAYEFKTNLVYGSNGKVEKALFMNGASTMYTYEFEYNAAGQITKRKRRSADLTVAEDDNTYTYDAAGRLAGDSMWSAQNNKPFGLYSVSKFIYTGDNITEAEYYKNNSGVLSLNTRIKYDYDSGVNPFHGMEYEYYFNEAGSAIYTIQLISSNNMLKTYTADGNGGWTLQTNSSYEYNSNKYARKAVTKDLSATQFGTVVTEYYF